MIKKLIEITDDGIRTHCKECIFYRQNNDGEQIGCRFWWRSDVFKKKEQIEYDENGRFSITRLCNAARDEDWKAAHSNEELLELKIKVEQDIRIGVDLVIFDDTKDMVQDVFDRIKVTFNSALKMDWKPNHIYIMTRCSLIDMAKLMRVAFDDTIKYTIIQSFDDDIIGVVKKSNQKFLALVQAGNKVKKLLICELDTLINYDLEQIVAILPGTKSGSIIATNLYTEIINHLGEFNFETLYDYITQKTKYGHTVRRVL